MEEIKISDLRQIQYSHGGADWTFKTGGRLNSINATIDRIYLDDPYLVNTGKERFIIDVFSDRSNKVLPWKIVQVLDGSVFITELAV